MTLLASTAGSVAYYGLAVFLVAVGLGSFFALFKRSAMTSASGALTLIFTP